MKNVRFDFRSIKNKIIFFGGLALLLVAICIIGYAAYTLNSTAVFSAKEDLKNTAVRESAAVKAVLEEPYTTSSGIAALLTGIREKESHFPRNQVIPMLEGVLKDRPLYNGIYTIWEPGVFDGKDADYRLKDGYDKTGRLRIYWYRDGNGTLVRKLYDQSSNDPGSYYDIPKKSLKGAIIEPYIETMQGAPVLMASLVTPVIRDGRFNGIVAVDIAIQDIEKMADSLNIYKGTGKMLVVSNEGVVAGVTGNKAAEGRPLKEIATQYYLDPDQIQQAIKSGREATIDDGRLLGSVVPVQVGNTETPWAVIIFAPREVVAADAFMQTLTLILIGILISALGLLMLFLVAQSIANPIARITKVSLQIAEGDLDTHIGIHQRDEVGRLADAFRLMRKGLREKADAAAKMANGNLKIMVPVAGEKDVLGHSMKQMKISLSELTDVMNNLSESAADGDLSIRGDISNFSGEYARIVSGVNATLDAVIGPVNEGMRLAGEYSHNNFRARFNRNIPVRGDFIRFREAMDDIGIQVSDTLQIITGKMVELTASAEEAQASADEVARGAAEVAENAESVSHHADEGSDGTTRILSEMNALSTEVADISVKTGKVSNLAEEGNRLSNEGETLAKAAGEGMEGIKSATADIAGMIQTIKQQMEQINSVIAIITAISDETNLLALNAAIEAARAGDAGRGFAVVAEEVKELAMESHHSAEKIEEMIRALSRESDQVSSIMERAQAEVDAGYAAVQQTLDIFGRIVVVLYDITRDIREVAAASGEQVTAVEEISARIDDVHQTIRKTAENAVSNAAISEESSAAVDQIQRVIENVNQVVITLQKEIDRFTI